MSKTKTSEHVPTYYVPKGDEYFGASRNEPAEKIVAQAVKEGRHVHTWAAGTGTHCPTSQCDPKVARDGSQGASASSA